MPSNDTSLIICHYEDEPARVDFPGLIETALFQHPGVSGVDIDSSQDCQTHALTFSVGGTDYRLHYLLRKGAEEMREAVEKIDGGIVILTMMDLSMTGAVDRSKGALLVKERLAHGAAEPIWMVTGYPVEAHNLLQRLQLDVKIISKPTNPRLVRDDIIEILFRAVPIPSGAG